MATARGGSKPNGGNGRPVTLVRIVVVRNKAVQPPYALPVTKPYSTMRPDAIPIKLKRTWIWRNKSVGIPKVIAASSKFGWITTP
jgi:hypothetical protein